MHTTTHSVHQSQHSHHSNTINRARRHMRTQFQATSNITRHTYTRGHNINFSTRQLRRHKANVRANHQQPTDKTKSKPIQQTTFRQHKQSRLRRKPRMRSHNHQPQPKAHRLSTQQAQKRNIQPILPDTRTHATQISPNSRQQQNTISQQIHIPLIPTNQARPQQLPRHLLNRQHTQRNPGHHVTQHPRNQRHNREHRKPNRKDRVNTTRRPKTPSHQPRNPVKVHNRRRQSPLKNVRTRKAPRSSPPAKHKQNHTRTTPVNHKHIPIKRQKVLRAQQRSQRAALQRPTRRPIQAVRHRTQNHRRRSRSRRRSKLQLRRPQRPRHPNRTRVQQARPTTPQAPVADESDR